MSPRTSSGISAEPATPPGEIFYLSRIFASSKESKNSRVEPTVIRYGRWHFCVKFLCTIGDELERLIAKILLGHATRAGEQTICRMSYILLI
jgi:hypothetical protein